MFSSFWPVIGALGIWCIELSYFPQIIRLYKRKEAHDISILFPGLNLIGRILACIYAMHANVEVLAFGFMAGIVLRAGLLLQVIYYRYFYQKLQQRKQMQSNATALQLAIINQEPQKL